MTHSQTCIRTAHTPTPLNHDLPVRVIMIIILYGTDWISKYCGHTHSPLAIKKDPYGSKKEYTSHRYAALFVKSLCLVLHALSVTSFQLNKKVQEMPFYRFFSFLDNANRRIPNLALIFPLF